MNRSAVSRNLLRSAAPTQAASARLAAEVDETYAQPAISADTEQAATVIVG